MNNFFFSHNCYYFKSACVDSKFCDFVLLKITQKAKLVCLGFLSFFFPCLSLTSSLTLPLLSFHFFFTQIMEYLKKLLPHHWKNIYFKSNFFLYGMCCTFPTHLSTLYVFKYHNGTNTKIGIDIFLNPK